MFPEYLSVSYDYDLTQLSFDLFLTAGEKRPIIIQSSQTWYHFDQIWLYDIKAFAQNLITLEN